MGMGGVGSVGMRGMCGCGQRQATLIMSIMDKQLVWHATDSKKPIITMV